MREIKFRAWDEMHKKMLYEGDKELDYYAMTFDGRIVTAADTDLVMADGAMAFLKLMQYTGLKDKNGTEIYEGDILVNGRNKWEVFWHIHKWLLRHTELRQVKEIIQDIETCEVIGNIYENPELLKTL